VTSLALWLAPIRNRFDSLSGRSAPWWIATVLIAVLLPSFLAAPLLLARLRRGEPE